MGILSSSVSITQYHVEGKLSEPILESVASGLKKNAVEEIDNESSDKAIGWTCFNNPFSTDFNQSPFLIGTHLIFSMRIDKKAIPSKIVQKHYTLEMTKKSRPRDMFMFTISGVSMMHKAGQSLCSEFTKNRVKKYFGAQLRQMPFLAFTQRYSRFLCIVRVSITTLKSRGLSRTGSKGGDRNVRDSWQEKRALYKLAPFL